MSPELMMWFMLATKMAVTALFVTAATIIAERLGAMVGALVATASDQEQEPGSTGGEAGG
jgi:zinc transporter ZupT